jgi:hypothetical protein
MRRGVAILLCAMAASAGEVAHAHSCAPAAIVEKADLGVRAALAGIFGWYRNTRFEGSYQGGRVSFSWSHPKVELEAGLPFYRIERNGLSSAGLGDVPVSVRWRALTASTLHAGLTVAATLPTGDAAAQLGMGHVMLMPHAWLAKQWGAVVVSTHVGYGRALASSSDGHHGAGPIPLVDPMNSSEIFSALGVTWRIHDRWTLRAGVMGALPVALQAGEARLVASFGATLSWRDLFVDVEGQVPLYGNPFLGRTLVNAGVRF